MNEMVDFIMLCGALVLAQTIIIFVAYIVGEQHGCEKSANYTRNQNRIGLERNKG